MAARSTRTAAGRGTIWILEDIDAHHNNEAKLRRAVLEMQAIMDNAPLAIAFMRDHRILRHNAPLRELFGHAGDGGVVACGAGPVHLAASRAPQCWPICRP
jgi:PAS domain-containing protein